MPFIIEVKPDGTYRWNHDRMETSFYIGVGLFYILLILVPVGVLFLVDLSKAAMFGVVVAFVCLCGISAILFPRQSGGQTLFGLCAYTAVLAAFLVLSNYGGVPNPIS